MFTAYKKFWTHYADFEGKSTRSDYWWSVLCNVLITLPFGIMAFGSILVAIFNVVQQATYYDYEGEFDPSIFISSLGKFNIKMNRFQLYIAIIYKYLLLLF